MFLKVDPGSSVENAKKRQFYNNSTNIRKILENNLRVTYETVTVGLIGPSLDIYTTKISKNYSVNLDLSKLEKGDHTVTLGSQGFADTLTVMVVPDTVNIRLSEKIRETLKK